MHSAALAAQITLLVYFEITTLVDLFPFNGILFYPAQERRAEAARNGVVMLVPILLTATGRPGAVAAACAVLLLLLLGALLTWWLPYATGRQAVPLPNQESWPDAYNRLFARTIAVLPRRSDPRMPTPNLEHTILHGLILLAALLTLANTGSSP